MSIESKIQTILEAIVDTEDVKYNDDMNNRLQELKDLPIYDKLINNVDKMVVKISKLKDILTLLSSRIDKEYSVPWIDDIFDRLIFASKSIVHSIPSEMKNITSYAHKILLLYSINNKEVIIHGSFCSYMFNNNITYSDIDATATKDDMIYIISSLIYIFFDIKTNIISIPYIPNHRQLRINGSDVSICDVLKIDVATYQSYKSVPIFFNKALPNILNYQHPSLQFLNYFKMFHLRERRMKMRHYKDNQKLILKTIYQQMLKSIRHNNDSFMKIEPYNIKIDTSINNIIIMNISYKNVSFNIFFHHQLTDNKYLDYITDYISTNNPKVKEVIVFNPLNSIYPECRVETYSSNGNDIHINISRNEIFKITDIDELLTGEIKSIKLAPISILNMLSLVGLHYFFTSNFNHKIINPYVRIIRTIVELSKSMTEPIIDILYSRIKNDGPHIIRSIKSDKLYIKSINNIYPISIYKIINSKLDLQYHCDIQEYIENYKKNNNYRIINTL